MTDTSTSKRTTPLREFIATENGSAFILLATTIGAIVWANSPWSSSYERLWHTEIAFAVGAHELALDLRHWINEGLMALFFFVVGLEIRREFDMGELRERRRVAAPVLAAAGGMVLPALLYLAFNAGSSSSGGWGITMGTDTAFALGVLTVVAGASTRARNFLLTAVIVDDVVALTVIAIAYTDNLSLMWIGVAIAFYVVIFIMRAKGVTTGIPYFLVGAGMWLATLASGVHATIAGVAVGVLVTAYPPSRSDLEDAGAMWRLFREQPTPEYARTASRTLATAISPNERLEHLFHSWTSYVIVPLFALANAGITLDGGALRRAAGSSITIGIIVGLVVGKLVGIMGASFLVSRRWLGGFPLTVPWPPLAVVGAVCGIGFTVSLLIADITFDGEALDDAKIGILGASLIATLLAFVIARVSRRLPARAWEAGADKLAPDIIDLADPVDPEVDHIRGPVDARVTLVEYGDFECPYCGRAEPVIRDLAAAFGDDVAFVFRHLPLTDVHEHAWLASEAVEAADAQGAFWPMHDVLMAEQEALGYDDLVAVAERLGLDVDRFAEDIRTRRHALRVARDVSSADSSGAVGTPTFFINGRRYAGSHELEAMKSAVRSELARARR